MRKRVEDRLLKVACAAFGVACASALWSGLHAPRAPVFPVAAKVAVQVRAAAAPAAAAVKPAVPAPQEVMLLRTEVATPRKARQPAPVREPAKAAVAEAPPSAPAPVEVLPLGDAFSTISQPQMPQAPRPANRMDLPVIDTGAAPPAPAEEPAAGQFSLAQVIKPGGAVLVLGVLVDDTGTAINARVVVPSSFPLKDVAASFAHLGRRWTDLNPPLQPGEQRWLEILINHPESVLKDSDLP